MPVFIVHELGKPARTATLDKPEVVIGRDDTSDILLNNVSVSRHHAVVQQSAQGWAVTPLNPNNPLVVNGQGAEGQTLLSEGSEIQIGKFMVIFSLQPKPSADYLTDRKQYEAKCTECAWEGVFSAVRRTPECPKCGGTAFTRKDDLKASQNKPAISGPTAYLPPEELEKINARMKEAKQAQILRISGIGTPRSFPLTERRSLSFGKQGKSEMSIEGLTFGKAPFIAWKKNGYAVHKGGFLPRVKVNGKAVSDHRMLKSGDTVEIGKSTFRFLVD